MCAKQAICILISILAISLFASGCGAAAGVGAVTSNLVGGFAVKGPVAGGSVNIYELLGDGTKGELLGTTITGPEGSFQITVEDYEGPLFLEVVSGAFIDEATGVYTELSEENPLIALVPAYDPEEGLSDLSVTPLTSIAAGLAQSQIAEGADPAEAAESANETIAEYFGLDDILTTPPPDLTDPEEETDEGTDYALIMAGLSTVARDYGVDTMDLIDALAADISDGSFDGQSEEGAITVGGEELSADVTGSELAAGIEDFVESDMNATGVTTDEASAVVTSVSGNTGSLPAPWIDSVTPDSAVVGAMVTINGSNFAEGARVFFGDVEADDVATGGSTKAFAGETWYEMLTCTVPAWDDYGVRNVKVENPDGRSAVLGDGFTYLTNPLIGSMTPDLGSIDGGEAVTISGNGFFDGLTVLFGGTAATNVVVVSRNTIACTTPAHIGDRANITVTNPDARADILTESYTFWNGIWKVNAAAIGGGDGYNWATAFSTFDEAEAAVSADDEVWVAAGSYTNGGGSTDSVLELPEDTSWYGGFLGIETDRSERDFLTNVTIVDGQDESYHVVLGAEGSLLSGFTMTGGNALGSGDDAFGGGYYASGITASVADCIFDSNNVDNDAGGLYIGNSANIALTNSTFTNNTAEWGGAIFIYNGSTASMSDCVFSGNSANSEAGAIHMHVSCTLTIVDSTISTNSSYDGGAICCNENNSLTISNTTFTGNTAGNNGGAIFSYTDSPVTISNCTFTGNTAVGYGGGIMLDDSSSGLISGTTFAGNSADFGAGIYLNSYSAPTVSNCDFDLNTVTDSGGGIACNDNCSPTISNCTFTSNDADNAAGAIANYTFSDPTVSDCSFTSNTAAGAAGAVFNWSYSDPAFSNCTFTSNSAGTDAGAVLNYGTCTTTYTNCTFTGNSAGTYGGAAHDHYGSVSTYAGCTFTSNTAVADGGALYTDDSCTSTFSSCTFDGNETTAGHGGAIMNNACTLNVSDCDFDTNVAYYDGGAIRNVGGTHTISDTTFVDNVTGVWRFGGAIRNDTGATGMVSDCVFDNNYAMRGAAVAQWDCSPTFNRCVFRNHGPSLHEGIVLYAHNTDSQFNNCLFTNNEGTYGAVIGLRSASYPVFTNCTFAYNASTHQGGVLWNENYSHPNFINCILYGNTAVTSGNEFYNAHGSVYISYSIRSQTSGTIDQGGNENVDPLFVDADGADDVLGTDDDDFRLQAGSPAIDTGTTSGAPTDDLDGNTRDPAPDKGAYEYDPGS